ncbi:hypothetical protein AWR36_005585 [Microbulbifer flavimaris]|uniref:Uncharacterized protein n=1 Tax=Microbulbifer flavimaris TaxID=1781068 RepID=A0ABX4HZB2_9GAMM|nr:MULTISPECIES: hypothetical protein [Microbulbifer]KUJ83335.1 hypothetical protein AVO43_05575 [Microbulbifer sp. ZGT114]PCO05490.1 hypothetical protein AWR36_005585 [Microbulbifer flavimaris]
MSGVKQDVPPALVLLGVLGLGPWQLAVGDAATATASARITLHIAPRAELHHSPVGTQTKLCLYRQPEDHYRVEVRDQDGALIQSFSGRRDAHCLPIVPGTGQDAGRDTKGQRTEVMIMAQ